MEQRYILKLVYRGFTVPSEPYYGTKRWGADVATAGPFASRADAERACKNFSPGQMKIRPLKALESTRRIDNLRERLAKALGVGVRSGDPDTEWAHLIATAAEMTRRLNDVARVPGEIAVNHIRREVALRTVHEMNRRARRGAQALRETLQVDIREGKWTP